MTKPTNDTPTRADMAAELIDLAASMRGAAARMRYVGGFNGRTRMHARELDGAASLVKEWAAEIGRAKPKQGRST